MKTKEVYEQRVVAFIDILGFKSLVNKSDSDNIFTKATSIETIMSAFDILREEKLDYERKQVSLFSDSLIISYPLDTDYLTFLLMDLSRMSWDLIKKGIFIRGGIAIGNLYHSDDVVFGKALNDAYYLESECAIFPRIILTEETYESLEKTVTYKETRLMFYLVKDIDGFYYFDMLSAVKDEFESEDSYLLFLKGIKDLIADNPDQENLKLKQKYEWLQSKLDKL